MKLFFSVLYICYTFTSGVTFAQDVQVPDVGSVWESVSEYSPMADDGSPPRREREIFKVDRMQDGRPVFAGRMFGLEGEIVESTKGTIVYALECKNNVPNAMLVAPRSPNQCVGHVCKAPRVGSKPFVRPTFVYVPIYGCQEQKGEYIFTAVSNEEYEGNPVTVGEAKFYFRGTLRNSWKSYIKKGVGQVFAQDEKKKTKYEKVEVLLVPYPETKVLD